MARRVRGGKVSGVNARLLAIGLSLYAVSAEADEGQWPPAQIHELDPKRLSEMGLELAPKQLWDPATNDGRLAAAVNYSGCSAAFVSKHGLIATNHHCAYGAIQAQSTVEHDYLRDGFLARTRSEELQAKGRSKVRVLQSIADVTAQIRKAALAAADDAARAKAVESLEKKLVEKCEAKRPGIRCAVAESYLGAKYELFEYLELRDVRIVYAPPSSVGEYGGDIDNWMWPRHTGDFTLLRAYTDENGAPADFHADNIPYQPKHIFPVSAEGVGPDDFVAVVGYPGRTDRYLPAPEVERYVRQVFPSVIELYGEWIEILEKAARRDSAVDIKTAAHRKSLSNRHKNARGMLDGIARMSLVDRRKAEDEALAAWAEQRPEKYGGVLGDLKKLSDERAQSFPTDFLLSNVQRGANLLALAVDLVRRAKEQKKPDLERAHQYMERNRQRLWERQERRLRDFDRNVDAALLNSFLSHADKLGAGAFRGRRNRSATQRYVNDLLKSKLRDAKRVKDWFDHPDIAELARSEDPMIELAMRLSSEIELMEARHDARHGRMLVTGPLYVDMLRAVRQGPVYPDANGTLRFSYASVRGYSPQDGLWATPQTRLTGAIAKHTGETPFAMPQRIIDKAEEGKRSYWASPQLGDVPVCFLSNADTTGGNSGSPAINGKGELVGLNFDRVWENIAGDFGYNVDRSRNVIADVRYMLFILDRVEDASALLEELGVAKHRGARRVETRPEAGSLASEGGAGTPKPKGSNCRCVRTQGAADLLAPLLGAALFTILARRRTRFFFKSPPIGSRPR